jgi:hypothetical protein
MSKGAPTIEELPAQSLKVVPMADISLSPTARAMLRTKRMVWGIALLLVGLSLLSQDTWWLSLVFLLIGLPLAVTGVLAAAKAHKFNKQDAAIANNVRQEFGQLLARSPTPAFDATADGWEVPEGSVVELQRHFDQDTVGGLQGTLSHRYSMFSSSFGSSLTSGGRDWFNTVSMTSTRGFLTGLSNLDLQLNSVTRDNLMGDALFSVLEFETASGHRDTMRLISMSQPAAASWVGGLVENIGHGLGGRSTHAGTAVLNHIQAMVDHYTPRDISYTTDRLMALERRSRGDKAPTIRAQGQPVGRNAMLATTIHFTDGQVTRLFPIRFPDFLGHAMGLATSRAFEEIEAPQPARLT